MESEVVRKFREDLLEWAQTNLRDYPWRRNDATLYEVFVAEFFLTQTPADNVASVYPEFLARYPSLGAIEEAELEHLTEVIQPLGFQNMRAEALSSIAAEYEELPTAAEELTTLTRVGPYVANATLCFALGNPLPIVDRNVDRVYSRVFPDEWPKEGEEQWRVAAELVPDSEAKQYNLALLDFGAMLCTPTPKCMSCFARSYCRHYGDEIR